MKEERYTSGTFCLSIDCAHHKPLEQFSDDEYLEKKALFCKDCYAWKFYLWLKDKNWKVVRTIPEMSIQEIAAHLRGIDPSVAKDLDIDEILSL